MRFHQTLTLFVAFGLLATQALAGEKIDQQLDVPATGTLFIDNTRGLVKVIGWDKPQIHLKGELDDSARKLIFKNKGHKTLIKVVMRGVAHSGDNSNLQVHMPKGLKLRFKGVDSSFKVADLVNGIEGHTINGDLYINNVHRKMNVSSVSGKVKVSESSGMARVESVSGKVDLSGMFKEAKIKSMSGNIIANIANTDRLEIENVSGDTVINGNLQNRAFVALNSVSGDIHYQVNGELNAHCDIASQFGGKIMNLLTDDMPWRDKMAQRKLKFVSGDGSGKLVMHTVSGAVTIEK